VASCALLFATPVTREEFFAAAEGEYLSDYAALTLRGRPAIEVWEERYSRICAAAADLMEVANAAGVVIVRRVTSWDLHIASQTHDTLIIFAHWKGERIARRDLLCGLNEFYNALSTNRTPAGELLREYVLASLQPHAFQCLKPERAELLCGELINRLNEIIASGALTSKFPERVRDLVEADSPLAKALSRDLIDEALQEVLAPGNKLELFDGLHAPGAIEKTISPQFHGVIDLATCHSAILAACLKQSRGDDLLVIQNDNLLDVLPRYRIVAHTLAVVGENGSDYEKVRFEVERALIDEFRPKRWSFLDRILSPQSRIS